MSLLSNLRERRAERVATAIPAIAATQPKGEVGTVARIATVAVATPKEGETATSAKVGAGDTAMVPFDPHRRHCSAQLPADDERAIRAWLALIEETDPATIDELIGQCQRDMEARDYFIRRAAAELPNPDTFPDDRRLCTQCLNFRAGACLIARPGGLVSARRGYRPVALPVRCAGFAPMADDEDQRPGADRWPGLLDTTL